MSFFSKINPDAHFSTKINTFTYYKGGGGGLGAIVPRSQRSVKMEAFFLHQILHARRVDSPVMMLIHICARGGGGGGGSGGMLSKNFFFIKMVQSVAF